jgi:endo-1,4-beta-xylanase
MLSKFFTYTFLTRSGLLFIFNVLFFQLFADTIQTTVPHLKEVYVNDFKIGCLLSYKHVGFPSDPVVSGQSAVIEPDGGYLTQYHMNSMSPGNNMKAAYTVNLSASAAAYNAASTPLEKDSIDKHPIIKFNGDLIAQLNWAKRQGLAFRGHTLVWHASAPAAFFRTGYSESGARVLKEVMLARMENYIKEVIRLIHESWPGLLTAMDVVNEAVSDNGVFRTSGNEWYATFNDNSYVMKAFEYARKYTQQYGETQLKLYYNDYNTDNSVKADGIVNLVKPIYEAGYLDGIGMQEHSNLSFPTAANFKASYDKFYPICNEMAITEIDISTKSGTNFPSDEILQAQANQYANLFKCFVERSYYSGRGKIINVSKDGLNDKYTFVTNQSTSLWDEKNQCKPAFYAVANVGLYYNRLDTLIKYAENLKESDYSAEEWTDLQAALLIAKGALINSYSSSVSAVDELEKGISILLNPPKVGIKSILNLITVSTSNKIILLKNLPGKCNIVLYSFNGTLLNSLKTTSSSIQIPFLSPCILRVTSGNEITHFKILSSN